MNKQQAYDYPAKPGHIFTLYKVFSGGYVVIPIYVAIAGNMGEYQSGPVLALIVKLPDKMI